MCSFRTAYNEQGQVVREVLGKEARRRAREADPQRMVGPRTPSGRHLLWTCCTRAWYHRVAEPTKA